ncbi:MAG: hypothetical protein P4L35_02840 [Ignavibacteriaceae bacterium]|nr:hypothetical protein [Ignavibacteriaceae bacterium]
MSAGQQLLVLGAIVLLSIFILRVYTTENSTTKNVITNSAIIKATGIAQTMLEQIQTEAFDSATVTKAVSSPAALTPVARLGKDPGENTITQFNDVDDYNNYNETDVISNDTFKVNVKVSYSTKMNPDVPSAVPTFSKRVDVSVYNKYLNLIDTLKLSKIISYY